MKVKIKLKVIMVGAEGKCAMSGLGNVVWKDQEDGSEIWECGESVETFKLSQMSRSTRKRAVARRILVGAASGPTAGTLGGRGRGLG